MAPAPGFNQSHDLIRVWRVHLEAIGREDVVLDKLLSSDEMDRARRFRFDRDRRRFIAARGALRSILGGYLGISARDVEFSYGPHGKPMLANPRSTVRFNVSHSHEIALIAVTHNREVGIDVEFLRPMLDLEQLVAGNFSRREVADFHALPPERREAAFFAGWTRKEAYVKAHGGGLSVPLQDFSVSLAPDGPFGSLVVDNNPSAQANWTVASLPVHPDYAGALAAQGTNWHFDWVDWKP